MWERQVIGIITSYLINNLSFWDLIKQFKKNGIQWILFKLSMRLSKVALAGLQMNPGTPDRNELRKREASQIGAVTRYVTKRFNPL